MNTFHELYNLSRTLLGMGYDRRRVAETLCFLEHGLSADDYDNVEGVYDRIACRRSWRERFTNPGTVTGYLLEIKKPGKEWKSYEFDCLPETNIWNECMGDDFMNNTELREGDKYAVHTEVGFYPALGVNVWVTSSDTWLDRLGVDFDARYTPNEFISPINTWGGECAEYAGYPEGTLWRVRKVTVSAEMSDLAKRFFLSHPTATWMPTVK